MNVPLTLYLRAVSRLFRTFVEASSCSSMLPLAPERERRRESKEKMGLRQGVARLAVEIPQAVCSACDGGELVRFFEMLETPTNRVTMRATREAALKCGTGRIELGFCVACGAISNMAFDPARVDYDPIYDNSLYFSPTFQKYSEGVARDLVERYDLHGKKVIEIGCGKSAFLAQGCALGNNRGI